MERHNKKYTVIVKIALLSLDSNAENLYIASVDYDGKAVANAYADGKHTAVVNGNVLTIRAKHWDSTRQFLIVPDYKIEPYRIDRNYKPFSACIDRIAKIHMQAVIRKINTGI